MHNITHNPVFHNRKLMGTSKPNILKTRGDCQNGLSVLVSKSQNYID